MTQSLPNYGVLGNEALWTPETIYEIKPPKDLIREGYDYKEGTDNVDGEEVKGSLLDGVRDFFVKLFKGLGDVIGGALHAGVGLLINVAEGVAKFIGGIVDFLGNAIGKLFGNRPEKPLPEAFSPFATDLEGAVMPLLDAVDESLEKNGALREEVLGNNGAIAVLRNQTLAKIGDQGTMTNQLALINGSVIDPVQSNWNSTATGWMRVQEVINFNFTEFQNFQISINAQVQEQIENHQKALESLKEATRKSLQFITRSVYAKVNETTYDPDRKLVKVTMSRGDLTVEALSGWAGAIIMTASQDKQDSGDYASGSHANVIQEAWPVPDGASRTKTFTAKGTRDDGWNSAVLSIQINPGKIKEAPPMRLVNYVPARDRWVDLSTFTTSYNGEHNLSGIITWYAATYHDSYGLRIVVDGKEVRSTGIETRVGPIGPWGDGRIKRFIDTKVNIPSGKLVRLQAWAGASGDDQRQIAESELKIWWVEEVSI